MIHLGYRSSILRRWSMSLPRLATFVIFGTVAFSGLVVAAWFARQGTISTIFQQLNQLQESPPMWIEAPMQVGQYLLVWTVALMLGLIAITKVSPRPRAWSRTLVVGMLLILTLRYLLWRSLSTLNLSTPLNGVFSLGLFLMELLLLSGGIIQLCLLLRANDRRPEADRLANDVLSGSFRPTVDILIPTYNEPIFILRRTIIGCQALDYAAKQIFLLDDTRRPEVEALAAELGCEYRTRPDNRHAKAGNLNHAIGQTSGELIVIFDADFVPTRNFLTRTVGFFQDPQVALLQTPQSFYNPDPIARNLGLENTLTPDEEVFYRQIQPIRDGVGGVICAGTSFVVRRSALTAAGCFVTESLSEDYFTGIRLAAKGYRVLYLNEKLSAGLAADNIAVQALQRTRWAQGTLQAFFIKSNPLTIPGLNLLQRLAHLEGLLHWFTSLARVGLLFMPLAYAFLHVIPIRATGEEILYFFIPFYLAQITTFAWLNSHSRSAVLSDIYSLVLAFPLAVTVIKVMLNPFGKGFKVTPKGGVSDHFSFNWQLAFPLIAMFMVTAISLWTNLGTYLMMGTWQVSMPVELAEQLKGIGLGWLWSAYNLLMLSIALLILVDVPRSSPYEWYNLRRVARLQVGSQTLWGFTTAISEEGVEISLTQSDALAIDEIDHDLAQVELMEERLLLQGGVTQIDQTGEFPTVRLLFESLSLDQQRCLVELLYCRPGQWKSRCSPGEFESLGLLLKILLKPQFLSSHSTQLRTVSVGQR
ncbi:MAG: glycosyltransferase [Pegethrix bostrychoides GSE-TBD4-15B]|uniref:Glycosyltransferase n=1 Tax=Pegethrix bostrychoides GSE-TBD4-15B TaxID=2839662 RepID=A0A951PGR3_9CYAN|nr:glycosyltransferase [Pegethrix bostrychoides GSE-TBD4-15B]